MKSSKFLIIKLLKMSDENRIPQWLLDEMISYLYSHDLIMKSTDFKTVQHIPVSVFPSPVKLISFSFPKRFLKKLNFTKLLSINLLIKCLEIPNSLRQV